METVNNQQYGARPGRAPVIFGIISVVCGVMALLLFCTGINIPLAIVALVFGVLGRAAGKDKAYRTMSMVGVVCAILSVVMGIFAWAVLIANVPLNGVDNGNEYLQQYIEENGV